jgi:hypothetical protein
MTTPQSILQNPSPEGWTEEDGRLIANYLTGELVRYFQLPLEIAHDPACEDNRDRVQLFSDTVAFRVRSKSFGRLSALSVGGIVSAGSRSFSVNAIMFLFVFGNLVSHRGPGTNLELVFRFATDQSEGTWSVSDWMLDEFEEFEQYDFEYFRQLKPWSPNA